MNLSVSIAVLAAMLLIGIVAGCVTASYVSGDSGQTLSEYVNQYVSLLGAGEGGGNLFPGTLFNLYKYPLLSFLFGFTAFGILLIPATVCVRGFFLSFSVGSMIRLFGYKGMLLALAVYGTQALITIPCLLIISAQAMRASRGFLQIMASGKRASVGSVFPKGYFVMFGVCMIVIFLCVLLEIFVTPKLVCLAAASILN